MKEITFSVNVYTSFNWPYTCHFIINYQVVIDEQIPSSRVVIDSVKTKLHGVNWVNQSFYCNKADLDEVIKLVNRANKLCKLAALKNEEECSKWII